MNSNESYLGGYIYDQEHFCIYNGFYKNIVNVSTNYSENKRLIVPYNPAGGVSASRRLTFDNKVLNQDGNETAAKSICNFMHQWLKSNDILVSPQDIVKHEKTILTLYLLLSSVCVTRIHLKEGDISVPVLISQNIDLLNEFYLGWSKLWELGKKHPLKVGDILNDKLKCTALYLSQDKYDNVDLSAEVCNLDITKGNYTIIPLAALNSVKMSLLDSLQKGVMDLKYLDSSNKTRIITTTLNTDILCRVQFSNVNQYNASCAGYCSDYDPLVINLYDYRTYSTVSVDMTKILDFCFQYDIKLIA